MRAKLSLLLILLCALAVAAQQSGSPLTNADVIKMVKAGRPEATILIVTQNERFLADS